METYFKNCYTHFNMVRFHMCKTDGGPGRLTSSQQKLIITYICVKPIHSMRILKTK